MLSSIKPSPGGASAGHPKRVLFICGSLNQTTQMHAIAQRLPDCECFFTPYYGDLLEKCIIATGILEFSILGRRRGQWTLNYLRDHDLPVDLEGKNHHYDLVVSCSDLVVPQNVRNNRLIVVQEGIFDPEGFGYRLCRRFHWLPRPIGGTGMTGLSYQYDMICVASEGYRDHLIERGVMPDKIRVTGIPNFDHCQQFHDNDFPYRDYVLVCTSDTRETFKRDNRKQFMQHILNIARGRPLIFKLHPNENYARSVREIKRDAPHALVYQDGSAEAMIANCKVLITQYSSVVFVGLALGKECHSYFDMNELKRLCPIQTQGTSARQIAEVCRELIGPAPFPRLPRVEHVPTMPRQVREVR